MKQDNIGAENDKSDLGIKAFYRFTRDLVMDLITVVAGCYRKGLFERIKIVGFHYICLY